MARLPNGDLLVAVLYRAATAAPAGPQCGGSAAQIWPRTGGAGFDFASPFFLRVPHPCGLGCARVGHLTFLLVALRAYSSEQVRLIGHFSSLNRPAIRFHRTQWALPLCFLLL